MSEAIAIPAIIFFINTRLVCIMRTGKGPIKVNFRRSWRITTRKCALRSYSLLFKIQLTLKPIALKNDWNFTSSPRVFAKLYINQPVLGGVACLIANRDDNIRTCHIKFPSGLRFSFFFSLCMVGFPGSFCSL